MQRDHFEEEHVMFRDAVKRFTAAEITPHNDRWEKEGVCDRSMFTAAANSGFLGPQGQRPKSSAQVCRAESHQFHPDRSQKTRAVCRGPRRL